MSNPRLPSRLAEYNADGSFYPRELTEKDGKLYFINVDGSATVLNPNDVTGNSETATKLKIARTIGLSGVTANAQSFDGSKDIIIPITAVPVSIVTGLGAVATSNSYDDLDDKPSIPQAGDDAPKAAGTAAAGTGITFARIDHVHPPQTSVSGNAGTATKFASEQSIELTGDVTGSASSQAGWSIAATLANSGVAAGNYGPTDDASPNAGDSFTVPFVTVDAKGRITAAAARTITLPSSSHIAVTMAANSTSTASPGGGGTFTAIDSITKDSYGHVTKINTKTITLPTSCSTATYTATVGTSWSGSAAPYTQAITVNGILAADNPIVDVVLSNTYATAQTQLEMFGKLYRIVTAANKITVYATAKTTSNISIQLKCVR